MLLRGDTFISLNKRSVNKIVLSNHIYQKLDIGNTIHQSCTTTDFRNYNTKLNFGKIIGRLVTSHVIMHIELIISTDIGVPILLRMMPLSYLNNPLSTVPRGLMTEYYITRNAINLVNAGIHNDFCRDVLMRGSAIVDMINKIISIHADDLNSMFVQHMADLISVAIELSPNMSSSICQRKILNIFNDHRELESEIFMMSYSDITDLINNINSGRSVEVLNRMDGDDISMIGTTDQGAIIGTNQQFDIYHDLLMIPYHYYEVRADVSGSIDIAKAVYSTDYLHYDNASVDVIHSVINERIRQLFELYSWSPTMIEIIKHPNDKLEVWVASPHDEIAYHVVDGIVLSLLSPNLGYTF